jgi:hypothetical protein
MAGEAFVRDLRGPRQAHVCNLDQFGDAQKIRIGTTAVCYSCGRVWVVREMQDHSGSTRLAWGTDH